MSFGAKKYKQMDVSTASPGKVLIMLYEAAIRHVKTAVTCIEKNDVAGKGKAIGKAHDIINELVNSLDFEVGDGKIAQELERLYNFMIEELMQANIENNKTKLEKTASLLEKLLEAWKGAVDQVNGSNAEQGKSR